MVNPSETSHSVQLINLLQVDGFSNKVFYLYCHVAILKQEMNKNRRKKYKSLLQMQQYIIPKYKVSMQKEKASEEEWQRCFEKIK